MRILVTGAKGLIGQAISSQLAAQGHDILTLGRRDDYDFKAELSNTSEIHALALPQIDALLHCAGVVDEDFRDHPEKAMRMAIFGAQALVEKALTAGARRLVYISSAHIYGPMVGRVDESSAVNPVSDYAIAHFATEQVFRRAAKDGIAALAMRPCAVFGKLAEPNAFRRWSLIPFAFPREAVLAGRISIRSTGLQRRNFVGSLDLARCLQAWLDRPAEGWQVVNPLGAFSGTVCEFAQICAEISAQLTGRPCEITRIAPEGRTLGDDYDYNSLSDLQKGQSLQEPREIVTALMQAAIGAL